MVSNCALTSDLHRTSVLYPCFWCLVLLVIPKVELAFLDASAHCPEGFVLLCILTPKTLYSSLTLSTLLPPTTISYENVLLLLSICITEHFPNKTAFASPVTI